MTRRHEHDDEGDDWGSHRRARRRQADPAFAWMGPGSPPPMPPFPTGPGGPWGGGHRCRRGRGRMRRGMIRDAVLVVLLERPMHGYEVMTELAERSRGMWRPSPGSVYPTLAVLEDAGMVRAEKVEGKRTFTLTDLGRRTAEALDQKGVPWAAFDEAISEEQRGLHESLGALMAAVQQVQMAGRDEQVTAAQEALDDARKRVYRILADDEPDPRSDD